MPERGVRALTCVTPSNFVSRTGIDVNSTLVYTVVFIRRSGDQHHVITAWPSKRKQILLWHREMKKK